MNQISFKISPLFTNKLIDYKNNPADQKRSLTLIFAKSFRKKYQKGVAYIYINQIKNIMTPHTIVPPAVGIAPQPSDKYSTFAAAAAVNPNLISLLMNHAMQTELETKRKQQHFHEQQKSYVSALVGKLFSLMLHLQSLTHLSDVTVQVIASIWPNSISSPSPGNNKPIADLNTFLHHILKHSRTTHSTLQLAIFYLFRIRSRVQEKRNDDVYVSCGRRMFLAALISAHKYLQDKTYKNSAWSKVSGLNVQEINHAEKVMLQLLDYRLYVKKDTYDQWIMMLQTHLKVNPTATTTTATITATTTPTMQATATASIACSINTSSAHLSQIQQTRQALLRKAQQSLPSPPLEESYMSGSSSQKRKNSFSLEDQEDERISKRRC